MANANKALGQHMQEEPAEELRRRERHLALLAAMSIVLPTEGDTLAVKGQEPMVGNGDPAPVLQPG